MSNTALLSAIMSLLIIGVALLVSFLGIWIVSKDGVLRNDTFLMLNVHLSVALFIFSVSEIIAIWADSLPNPVSSYPVVGVIQLVGVLLWVEGVLIYLNSMNDVLRFTSRRYLLPIILIAISAIYIVFTSAIILLNEITLPYNLLIAVPIEIGFTVTIISMCMLLRWYHRGYLAIPSVLTILGSSLLLWRTLLWGYQIIRIADPYLQFIAIMGYLALGGSLALRSEKMAKMT
ncbi:MAG: hypothetical protein ACFFEF_02945 [Candidatus Thorarchaeota archaeon]